MILIVFILIGCVSADENTTIDNDININENYTITVEENESIEIEVDSQVEGNMDVSIDGEAIYSAKLHSYFTNSREIKTNNLNVGYHNIQFKFTFKNNYTPEIYCNENMLYFDFTNLSQNNTVTNFTYTFNTTLNIVKKMEIITKTENISQIDINYANFIPISINSSSEGQLNVYIDNELVKVHEFRKGITLNRIESSYYNYFSDDFYIEAGIHNISYEFEFKNTNLTYSIDSYIINKTQYFTIHSSDCENPHHSKICLKGLLNITPKKREYIEIKNEGAQLINTTYSYYLPVNIDFDSNFKLVVYVDGEEIYNEYIFSFFSKEHLIKTKINDTYISPGKHNITFNIIFENENVKYQIRAYEKNSKIFFKIEESEELEDTQDCIYYFNTTLNINEKKEVNATKISDINITYSDNVTIVFEYENIYLNYFSIFIDGKEMSYEYYDNIINIQTYFPYAFIYNEKSNIKPGNHTIRFEFNFYESYYQISSQYLNITHIKFFENDELNYGNGTTFIYEANLNIGEKEKTIHITDVINESYDDGGFIKIKLDEYNYIPIEDNYYEIGVIITNENGVIDKTNDFLIYDENGTGLYYPYNYKLDAALDAGKYNITIINLKDGTKDTCEFTVKKADIWFYTYYTTEYFNVMIEIDTDLYFDTTLIVTLDNVCDIVEMNSSQEYYSVMFTNLIPNTYTATFYAKGNNNYNDLINTTEIILDKQEAYLNEEHEVIGDEVIFNITNEAFEDITITITIGDMVKTVDNNEEYENIVFKNLKNGKYEAVIEFEGNRKYYPHKFTTQFEINKTEEMENIPDKINTTIIINKDVNETEEEINITKTTNESVNETGNISGNTNSTNENTTETENQNSTNENSTSYSEKLKEITEELKKEIYPEIENTDYGMFKSHSKSWEISKTPAKSIINKKSNLNIMLIIAIIILASAVFIYFRGNGKEEY